MHPDEGFNKRPVSRAQARPVRSAVIWLGLAMFFVVRAAITAFFIGGVGVVIYWTALTWVICGYICVPPEGMAEFDGKQWSAFMMCGGRPFLFLFVRIGLS